MKIYTNKRRARAARGKQFIGVMINAAVLLIVIFALILLAIAIWLPDLRNSPFLLAVMAILSTVIGLRIGNRLNRIPAQMDVINGALKGLGSEAVLYHYWLPASHFLVAPQGVFTLTTVHQGADLSFQGDRWRAVDGFRKKLGRFLTQNAIGSPLEDAWHEAQRAQRWLDQRLPEHGVTVQPVVVFTNPEGTFTAENPPFPIVYADRRKPSLKVTIRSQAHPTLSAEHIETINRALNISDES